MGARAAKFLECSLRERIPPASVVRVSPWRGVGTPIRLAKIRTPTTPSADEQQALSFAAGRTGEWQSHCPDFGRRFSSSLQNKHAPTLTAGPSCRASWYLSEGDEYVCPHKNPPTGVYSNFIMIVTTWKQPRCPPAGEWMPHLWSTQTME